MKKNLLFVAALTTALTAGTCPVSAVSIPVKAESSETPVLGTWYGNVWGTPATMTLSDNGEFSIKYDNSDNTELTGHWEMKDQRITVNEGTDDELIIDYDSKNVSLTAYDDEEEFVFTRDEDNSKKKTIKADKNTKEKDMYGMWKATKVETETVLAPVSVFGINNLFISLKENEAGLYMDVDTAEGVVDVAGLPSEFSDGILSFVIGASTLEEEESKYTTKKDNENGDYEDITCSVEMLDDGNLRLSMSDNSNVKFIMEKSSEKEFSSETKNTNKDFKNNVF